MKKAVTESVSDAARSIRNRYYEPSEVLVREATSNARGFASPQLLKQIAQCCTNHTQYPKVFAMIWKRLTHLEYKRHVVKALLVLDYLVRLQPITPAVQLRLVVDIRDRWPDIHRLAKLRVVSSSSTIHQIQRVAERLCTFINEYEQGYGLEQQTKRKTKKKKVVESEEEESEETEETEEDEEEEEEEEEEETPQVPDLLPISSIPSFAPSKPSGGRPGLQRQPSLSASMPVSPFGFDFGQPEPFAIQPVPQSVPRAMPQGWACVQCTFINPPQNDACEVCGHGKHSPKQMVDTAPKTSVQPQIPPIQITQLPMEISDDDNSNSSRKNGWACSWCSYMNPATAQYCEVCDREAVASSFAQTVKLEVAKKKLGSENSWSCSSCTFVNPASKLTCTLCNTPQPGVDPTKLKEYQNAMAEKQREKAKRRAQGLRTDDGSDSEIEDIKMDDSARKTHGNMIAQMINKHGGENKTSRRATMDSDSKDSMLIESKEAPTQPPLSTSLSTASTTSTSSLDDPTWSCKRCSFANYIDVMECEMCGMLKSQVNGTNTTNIGRNSPLPNSNHSTPIMQHSTMQPLIQQPLMQPLGTGFQPQMLPLGTTPLMAPLGMMGSGMTSTMNPLMNSQFGMQPLTAPPTYNPFANVAPNTNTNPFADPFANTTSTSNSTNPFANTTSSSNSTNPFANAPTSNDPFADFKPIAKPTPAPMSTPGQSSQPTTTRSRTNTAISSNVSPATTSRTKTWICSRCTFENTDPPATSSCSICGSIRSEAAKHESPRTVSPKPMSNKEWMCSQCTYHNKLEDMKCQMCDGPAPTTKSTTRSSRATSSATPTSLDPPPTAGRSRTSSQNPPMHNNVATATTTATASASHPPGGIHVHPPNSRNASPSHRAQTLPTAIPPVTLQVPNVTGPSTTPQRHRNIGGTSSATTSPSQQVRQLTRTVSPTAAAMKNFEWDAANKQRAMGIPSVTASLPVSRASSPPPQHKSTVGANLDVFFPPSQNAASSLDLFFPPSQNASLNAKDAFADLIGPSTRDNNEPKVELPSLPQPQFLGPNAAVLQAQQQQQAQPTVSVSQPSTARTDATPKHSHSFSAMFDAAFSSQVNQPWTNEADWEQVDAVFAAASPKKTKVKKSKKEKPAIPPKKDKKKKENKDSNEVQTPRKPDASVAAATAAVIASIPTINRASSNSISRQTSQEQIQPPPPVPTIASPPATAPPPTTATSSTLPSTTTAPLTTSLSKEMTPPVTLKSDYVSRYSNDKDEDAGRRDKICEEIIQTERYYVDCLFDLIAQYMEPMKRDATKIGITPKQIAAIFSNITVLAQFHQLFVSDLIKKPSLPQVFNQYADFLKMYTQYLNGYEKSIATINSLRTNSKFQKFINDKLELLKGRGIMTYLIMPVQRIPRYVLLLRELHRATPPAHPESAVLEEALSKIERIAEFVNESKRQFENMSKLLDIQNRLKDNNFMLLKPSRRLIKEGLLPKLKEGHTPALGAANLEQDYEPHLVFLFSDILIYTTPTFVLQGHVEVKDLVLIPYQPGCAVDHSITLAHRSSRSYNQNLAFVATDEAERQDWAAKIQDAILHCGDAEKSRYNRKASVVAATAGTLPTSASSGNLSARTQVESSDITGRPASTPIVNGLQPPLLSAPRISTPTPTTSTVGATTTPPTPPTSSQTVPSVVAPTPIVAPTPVQSLAPPPVLSTPTTPPPPPTVYTPVPPPEAPSADIAAVLPTLPPVPVVLPSSSPSPSPPPVVVPPPVPSTYQPVPPPTQPTTYTPVPPPVPTEATPPAAAPAPLSASSYIQPSQPTLLSASTSSALHLPLGLPSQTTTSQFPNYFSSYQSTYQPPSGVLPPFQPPGSWQAGATTSTTTTTTTSSSTTTTPTPAVPTVQPQIFID